MFIFILKNYLKNKMQFIYLFILQGRQFNETVAKELKEKGNHILFKINI